MLVKKLEDQEMRHRSEMQKLIENFDNTRLNMIERDSQMSGHRETERLKEVKELYESKSKDKDEELSRLRDKVAKNEVEYSRVRE